MMADKQDEVTSGDVELKKVQVQRALEDALDMAGLEISGEVDEAKVGREPHARGDEATADTRPSKPAEGSIPKTEWIDVTELFSSAAAYLGPGELVRETNFTLFDAMSAVEMMDCKMDATMQWKHYPGYPRSAKEAVRKGAVKLDGHSVEELVGIMDEALACVATWLEGHTLAQTVFTCLYLLESSEIEDLYLRTFSLAVIKTVEYMRECICRGGVYAEDDQQAVCYGFNMLTAIPDSSVLTSLKEAEEKAAAMLRHAGSVSASGAIEALVLRLKFTKNLFAFISSVNKGTAHGMEMCSQRLSQCVSLVNRITSTISVGVALDPSSPISLGFHPVINQHLLPPCYKPYAILSREKSCAVQRKIFLNLQKVLAVGKIDTFRELLESIFEFSEMCPNILVRSILVQVSLNSDRSKLFGSRSLENLLREDARVLCNPPSFNARSPVSTLPQGVEITNCFFSRAVAPFRDFLRLYCQHRAHQRHKTAKCLDSLGDLQQETERLDQRLHELTMKVDPQRQHLACFSTWLLYYIIQVMIDFLTLGFEYNLYSPFELHYIFWYLEYLYGWHHSALKSAERLIVSMPASAGKGKRKVKRREFPKERERETYVIHTKRLVCVGLMRALEALTLDKRLPQPSFEIGSQELTFKHRFLPFASVATPSLLTYSDYVKLAGVDNYKGRNVNLYEAAGRHFVAARTSIESIPYNQTEELESLMKVVKTNNVIMNLLAQGHMKSSTKHPTMDFSVHRHFPIVRIS